MARETKKLGTYSKINGEQRLHSGGKMKESENNPEAQKSYKRIILYLETMSRADITLWSRRLLSNTQYFLCDLITVPKVSISSYIENTEAQTYVNASARTGQQP